VSELVFTMIQARVNNQLPEERNQRVGVEDPDIQRFELCPDHKTPELQKIVDDTTKAINDGSLTLPEGI
jgi:hypothetical protein